MKVRFFLWVVCLLSLLCETANAADLIEVYRQALMSDPTYQQAIEQTLSTQEGLPISIATVLPNVMVNAFPSVTRTGVSGTFLSTFIGGTTIIPRNNTLRAYTVTLNVTQTVFDVAKFAKIAGAYSTSKSADATLNAALQDLMLRTSKAYFAILRDEENLSYNAASKRAYAEQLDQIREQYKVGLKTITDVYTAEASYDSSVASYIAAQTALTNDRENLRVITGVYYPQLRTLSDNFPLVTPQPRSVEAWVQTAYCQNWSIKAGQYNVDSVRQTVRQQFAGHLPTVDLQGKLDRIYGHNINGYRVITQRNGPGSQTDRQIAFNINVPIFSGGGVIALTNQAIYNYRASQQKLEKTVRDTINSTRQSYFGIVAGISKITADKQAIKSSISSLQGMEESYRVGTETLVDVLNQQQKVVQAQSQYASDRYDFVTNILTLKLAAGTLGFEDLAKLNVWLIEPRHKTIFKRHFPKKRHHKVKRCKTKKG